MNSVIANILVAMSSATTLPIVVFSVFFGVTLRMFINGASNCSVKSFLDLIQRSVLTAICLAKKIAPVGIFC